MLRFLLTLLLAVGLVFGAKWLLDHPGDVLIRWFGYDITLHIAVVVVVMLLFAGLIGFTSVSFWQLLTWPRRRRMRKQYRTLQTGLKQLTTGVTALAMGDEETAQAALKKAGALLPNDPLPQLLTAQLLQRQGKHEDARLQFKQLMQHEATAALATRRLIEEHVTAREWLEATRLAEEARKDAPKERWLILTLLDLYAREKNSAAMLSLTEGWGWQSPLTKDERHRYAALGHYLAAIKQPDAHKKAQSLRHAVGYAPEFLPAVIDYADALIADNETRRARKWLRTSWLESPSLALIDPILATLSDMKSSAQQRLLKPFLRGTLGATHHLLVAQQALDASEYERAQAALEQSLALGESKEACQLMAEVDQYLHGADAANRWLTRAVNAPANETWICDHCGKQHEQWVTHCNACQCFDSLRYTRPQTSITGVDLAPLKL